jgi:hypothetical protein
MLLGVHEDYWFLGQKSFVAGARGDGGLPGKRKSQRRVYELIL